MTKSFETKLYSLCDTRIKGPYRIAFLTDLHSHTYGSEQADLIAAIKKEKVDAIYIGGDMMVVKTYASLNLEPLEDILKAFAGKKPIYYALGNHEQRMFDHKELFPDAWENFRELLKKYRVPLLVNKTIRLKNGIELTGVRVPRFYYKKIRLGKTGKASPPKGGEVARRAGEGQAYRIHLAHTPAYVPVSWTRGADLVLSGHYHGGVMRLPNTRGLVSPQFIPFAKHCWGMYNNKKNKAQTAITGAGLGTHSVNLRIANPPELIIIEWNQKHGT